MKCSTPGDVALDPGALLLRDQRPDLRARVRFLPPQGHEKLSTFYRAADAVLVPSRSESFGLVALEAAACGIPVVFPKKN